MDRFDCFALGLVVYTAVSRRLCCFPWLITQWLLLHVSKVSLPGSHYELLYLKILEPLVSSYNREIIKAFNHNHHYIWCPRKHSWGVGHYVSEWPKSALHRWFRCCRQLQQRHWVLLLQSPWGWAKPHKKTLVKCWAPGMNLSWLTHRYQEVTTTRSSQSCRKIGRISTPSMLEAQFSDAGPAVGLRSTGTVTNGYHHGGSGRDDRYQQIDRRIKASGRRMRNRGSQVVVGLGRFIRSRLLYVCLLRDLSYCGLL